MGVIIDELSAEVPPDEPERGQVGGQAAPRQGQEPDEAALRRAMARMRRRERRLRAD